MSGQHAVRPAGPDDVGAVLGLVRDLATYERAADEVEATEDDLHRALFGPDPAAFCHVVEHALSPHGPGRDGAPEPLAGFALWFVNFSTWQGRHGMYLEDLFVHPDHRGHGHGRELLRTLAQICLERGYRRLEWAVLDWNTPARDFYAALGAAAKTDWVPYRLDADGIAALARG